MQSHHITTSESIEIEFIQAGEEQNQSIVFLHGLGANLTCFYHQIEYFSRYYHTLAISLRGHGQSTYPQSATAQNFTVSTLAGDVIDVLDQCNIDATHFVGNSAGGVVAYDILHKARHRVLSLTTFGTTAKLNTGKMGTVVVWLDQLLGPKIEAWLAKQTVSKQSHVAQAVADMIASTPKAVLVNTRRALLNYDYLPTIKQNYDVQLLLIQGDFDNEINAMLESTLLEFDKHPHAKVVSLANAGHMANLDQADEFNTVLLSFLQAQSS